MFSWPRASDPSLRPASVQHQPLPPRARAANGPGTVHRHGQRPAASMYAQREANETETLRNEVERLERLIDVLISAQAPTNPPSLCAKPAVPSYPSFPRSLPSRPPSSRWASSQSAKDNDSSLEDLEASDLARQLGELTLKTYSLAEPAKPQRRDTDLLKEAKRLFDNDTDQAAEPTSYAPFASLLASHDATFLNLREVLARVPARALAQQAAKSYFVFSTWWSNILSEKQYAREEQAVFAALEAASRTDPPESLSISLALCFAVWSFGLAMFEYNVQVTSHAGTNSLNAHFSRYSRAGLALANAVESPTLETLRTMLLLACHETLVSPGEEGRVGVAIFALAAQACLQLDLHRDPDTLQGDFSPEEAEDRRGLFHATLLQDSLLGAYKYITRAQFGSSPASYSRILDLDQQLVDLVKRMPDCLKPQSLPTRPGPQQLVCSLAHRFHNHERFRLHRSFLSRAYVDSTYAFSRWTCISSARQLLGISETPAVGSAWGCATYVRISAATALTIV
ncbi:hypothetical protein JCM10207_003753 [Rhodosporidiobolus poonsookiae]